MRLDFSAEPGTARSKTADSRQNRGTEPQAALDEQIARYRAVSGEQRLRERIALAQ
jgi:hypothetical protein